MARQGLDLPNLVVTTPAHFLYVIDTFPYSILKNIVAQHYIYSKQKNQWIVPPTYSSFHIQNAFPLSRRLYNTEFLFSLFFWSPFLGLRQTQILDHCMTAFKMQIWKINYQNMIWKEKRMCPQFWFHRTKLSTTFDWNYAYSINFFVF